MTRQLQSVTVQTRAPQTHKCCGVVEDVKYEVEARRAKEERQPWIVRKFMVFITIGIMGYAAYVYIGRLCVPFIQGRFNRTAVGVVLLTVFVILYLWTIWSYLKVVFTSPGYAKDCPNPAPQPPLSQPPPQPQSLPLRAPPKVSDAVQFRAPSGETRTHKTETSLSTTVGARYSASDSLGGRSYEDILLRTTADKTGSTGQPMPDAGDLNVLPAPVVSPTPAQRKLRKLFHPQRSKIPQPKFYVTRRPPQAPLLLPDYRHCDKEDILKPYRAHHCRHCGRCILRYDHHCPWIGQCVGARNHKYFLNFTEAGGVACAYIFSTLLGFTIHDSILNHANVDPQRIAVIALAGLFSIFTWTLTVSHVLLILRSQTTVEQMVIRHMEERESDQLNRALSFCDFRGKKLMRKEWDKEWGKLNTEGHIWWVEDKRKAWEDVMGTSIWGWFLPIGRGVNDGLSYPVNPRFDADGRWRRRSEWPPELQ
ncbi:zf-DHHC domain containing protein [Amanita muscaria]